MDDIGRNTVLNWAQDLLISHVLKKQTVFTV